jgi:hypothetical protein
VAGLVAARNGDGHGEDGKDRAMASPAAATIGSFRAHSGFRGGDFADGGRSQFGQ